MTACATFASYLVVRSSPSATLPQARTAALLAVFAMALWVLVLIARPLNDARLILVVSMAAAFGLLFALALACRVFTLDPPSGSIFIAVAFIVALSIGLLTCWRKLSSALHRRRHTPTPDGRSQMSQPQAETDHDGSNAYSSASTGPSLPSGHFGGPPVRLTSWGQRLKW